MLKVNNAHSGALKGSTVPYFRLYDLRYTWARRAAMSGIDLVTLAAMLGHSRIQMVLRYAHPTERHQAQATRKLEEFNAVKQMAELLRFEHVDNLGAYRVPVGDRPSDSICFPQASIH